MSSPTTDTPSATGLDAECLPRNLLVVLHEVLQVLPEDERASLTTKLNPIARRAMWLAPEVQQEEWLRASVVMSQHFAGKETEPWAEKARQIFVAEEGRDP